MTSRCLDIASISRYLHRLAELEDVLHVEGHVGTCARCREKLQRMKRYTETLFDEHDPAGRACTCPSLIALEHFRRDALQERQMIRIQSHLRHCPVCREWVGQRETQRPPWETPVFLLPATRPPDLDFRVARQGVRIAEGASALDLQALPTLLQRLDLPDPGPVSPSVTIHRSVSFRLSRRGVELRGRVDFLGYEGFRLTLGWPLPAGPGSLCLWTRAHIQEHWTRQRAAGEVTCLLMPGHYFVGASPEEEPLLALSVEPEFLTPQALAACGYGACRAGRFASALACFEQASQLSPATSVFESMRRRTQTLARRFGLVEADVDICWEALPMQRKGDAPGDVALGLDGDDVERIVALVESLRGASSLSTPELPGPTVPVSRQRFRPAYARLMRHLWASMENLSGSVESPISCP